MTHTHTPGPWDKIGCDIYSGEIKIARFIGIPWGRMLENEANMNLISSAPDLLAALEAIAKQADFSALAFPNAPGRGDLLAIAQMAGDAIAMATGKGGA